jgi:hypothetical protein
LFAENNVIPKQVVVYCLKGTNHSIELPFGTSLYDLKQAAMPNASDVTVKDGLRLFSPSSALVKVPESFFRRHPIETQVVLTSLRDASDPPGLPKDKAGYLESVDDLYKSDAYHSLSIEGYSVTPALIERVRGGKWNPAHHEEDRKNRDALAARGYWQAFQKVRETLAELLGDIHPYPDGNGRIARFVMNAMLASGGYP